MVAAGVSSKLDIASEITFLFFTIMESAFYNSDAVLAQGGDRDCILAALLHKLINRAPTCSQSHRSVRIADAKKIRPQQAHIGGMD